MAGPIVAAGQVARKAAEHVFTTVAKKGRALGIGKMDYDGAKKWYQDQARKVRTINVNRMVHDASENRTFKRMDGTAIGEMVLFHYDAKYKATLPYWDQVPLIFVVDDQDPKHFLGINLHYLSPFRRAQLMQALYSVAEKHEDKVVKLNLSYQLLKGVSKFSYFKPCLKSYLKPNVKSRFLYIEPKMWDYALLLPTQRFVGASAEKVWRESNKIIRGY
jgi:hypothetical protein